MNRGDESHNMTYEEAEKTIQESYIDSTYSFLEGTTTRVTDHKNFMKCYEIVMHQCDQLDNGEKLFKFYNKIIKHFLSAIAIPQTRRYSGENLIKAFVKQWSNFNMFAKCLERMFTYLNRYYLKNQSMKSLGQHALQHFNDIYFSAIKDDLLKAVLDEISKDRNNEIVERPTLKKAIKCYVDMGLHGAAPDKTADGAYYWTGDKNLAFYEREFEAPFLTKTKEEFEKKANLWNSQLNCPEYLMEVEKALTKEETNADFWLQPETKPKMLKRVEEQLISHKAEAVVQKDTGCAYMFEHKQLEYLKLMYKNFKRDEKTLELIIEKMNPYIEKRGEKIVKDETLLKDPQEFTQKLLDLKKEMDTMLEESFSNDMKF